MHTQWIIRYFILTMTVTLAACQTVKNCKSDNCSGVRACQRTAQQTCWKKVPRHFPNRGGQRATFILAMGANTGTGKNKLQKANNDAKAFKQAMQKRFNVPNKQVCLLEDVCRAEFERALIDLKRWVKPDDRVIIFFSGHGSYVDDDDGDEKKDENKKKNNKDDPDEVFVTSDVKDLEDPDRKNVVTDDRFVKLVNALPTERIITFIDACYSGGAYMGPENDTVSTQARVKFFAKGQLGTFPRPLISRRRVNQKVGGLAHINGVLLAATQEERKACETGKGGIFTMTFLTQLQGYPRKSFAKIFKYTQAKMQKSRIMCDGESQEPVIIGEFLEGD